PLLSRSSLPATSTLLPYTTLFRSPPPTQGANAVLRYRLISPCVQLPAHNQDSQRKHPASPFRCRPRYARGIALYAVFLPRYSLRSEEHTSELQSRVDLVCRLLLEK